LVERWRRNIIQVSERRQIFKSLEKPSREPARLEKNRYSSMNEKGSVLLRVRSCRPAQGTGSECGIPYFDEEETLFEETVTAQGWQLVAAKDAVTLMIS